MPLPDRPVSGESIATEWGTEIHDRVLAAKGTWLTTTGANSVTTIEKLNLDTVADDPGGWVEPANDRAVVPTDAQGLYLLIVDFDTVNGDEGDLTRGKIYLNGSVVANGVADNQGGVHVPFQAVWLGDLVAGDILEVYAETRPTGAAQANVQCVSFRAIRLTDALGA